MKQKFIDAVNSGNTIRVRFFISNEMLLDPRGRSCLEMINYAEPRVSDLYEKEDDNEYSYSEEELSKAFLDKIKTDLDFCFTKKLLFFYIEVASIVLKDKADELEREETEKHSRYSTKEGFSGQTTDGTSYINTEDNPILDAFERFYHSKGFWPTVGAIGAAFAYFLYHLSNKE